MAPSSSPSTAPWVHLELGSKAQVVVFDDADPNEAASALRVCRLLELRQECGAACRVLGPRVGGREFVEHLGSRWPSREFVRPWEPRRSPEPVTA
jgi:acyl-CoA reductase-like NAD-dependent aldehyde dehydrogenase